MKKFIAISVTSIMLALSAISVAFAENFDNDELCHDFSLGFPEQTYLVREGTTEEIYENFRNYLPEEMTLFDPYEIEGEIQIFIATDGNDSNQGTIDKPMKTLSGAIQRLKQYKNRNKGAVIYFREGSYKVDKRVDIPELLSGNDEHPLFISSYNNEEVKLYAATTADVKSKPALSFSNVSDRLNPEVASKIRAIDCSSFNMNYELNKSSEPQVTINGVPYSIAKWPNNGYAKFAKYDGADGENGVIESGSTAHDNVKHPFEFKTASFRPTTWVNTGDIWFYGRMNSEYLWERYNIDTINPEIPSIRSKTFAWEACKYTNYNVFYCYNILEELDMAGEYFYDKDTKLLYFYPVTDISDDDEFNLLVPENHDTVINISGAKNVVINGIEFGYAKTAIRTTGRKTVVQNCSFVSTQDYAVKIAASNCGIIYSKFVNCSNNIKTGSNAYETLDGLVNRKTPIVSNADRDESEIGRTFIQNNYFQSGEITLMSDKQCVVSHNYFGADTVISSHISARNHIVEYNKFVSFRLRVSDGAGFYNAGSFKNSHTIYRGNYARRYVDNVGSAIAFYMDDLSCTSMAYNNILVDCRFYQHGGSDHIVENNICIGVDTENFAAYTNSINYYPDGGYMEHSYLRFLNDLAYEKGGSRTTSILNEDVYKWDYRLLNLIKGYITVKGEKNRDGENYTRSETEDFIRAARYNVVKNNLFYNCVGPKLIGNELGETFENNYVTDKDPGFENAEEYDFDLKSDAEIFSILKDFEPLPKMDDIGIVFGKGQFKERFETEPAVIISPVNTLDTKVNAKSVSMDWSDPFGVSEYRLVVSENPDMSDPILDTSVSAATSNYELTDLKYDTVYYWYVDNIANDTTFSKRSSKTEIATFRTCRENELYMFEELDTGAIKNVITNIKSSLEFIVEDDGTDKGYGVYNKGTLNELKSLIADAESKIGTYKLNSQVQAAAEELKKDYVNIITDNAIPYTRKASGFKADNWLITSDKCKVSFAKDEGSVALEPNGASGMLINSMPLTPKEGIEFKIKYQSSLGVGWPGISTRLMDKTATSPYGPDGYYIVFSNNNIELQKNKKVIFTMKDDGKIPVNEWFTAYILTENTDEGVKTTFKVNDNVIFEYIDTDNPVYDIGYYGFKTAGTETPVEIAVP